MSSLDEEPAGRDGDARLRALGDDAPGTRGNAAQLLAARARAAAPDADKVAAHVARRAVLFAQVVPREEAADWAAQDAEAVRPAGALVAEAGGVELAGTAGRHARPVDDAEEDVQRVGGAAAGAALPALVEGTGLAGPLVLVNAAEAEGDVLAALADLLSHCFGLCGWWGVGLFWLVGWLV